MPVENEHKFILKNHKMLFHNLSLAHRQNLIDQFYLGDGIRFRRIEQEGDPQVIRVFSFKREIGGRVLEIERQINEADYLHAQAVAITALSKVRFKIPGREPDTMWDIDFLLDRPGGDVYFALAECEHPEGASYEMIKEIAPYVVYAVPPHEGRAFSNKKLSSRDYAERAFVAARDGRSPLWAEVA